MITKKNGRFLCLLLSLALTAALLSGCSSPKEPENQPTAAPAKQEADLSRCLTCVEDEPDTVDFQCTTIHYTVATNVFDRLVEMQRMDDGNIELVPSLAKSWEISEDGLRYTFHLQENVTFSNGSRLTASDVGYTLHRLLTHPDSCNQDVAEMILGAKKLEKGETEKLEGFELVNDHTFILTLEEPFSAFPACLSMPGASILDEETTAAAGSRFGLDPTCTIGTGPFIISSWTPLVGMTFVANPNCWSGAPQCEGVRLLYMNEPEEIRAMFDRGELDILDLDEVGNTGEFYMHGDIYKDRLYQVQRIGIVYIALNESVEPLNDVRVRKALQMSLNRSVLLDAVYSGRGMIENGIFSHGLYGFNPELPEIPFDEEQARALLSEAGFPEGFDLTVTVKSSSSQWEIVLMQMAARMWAEIGVRAEIQVIEESEFMRLRKTGGLSCYTAAWMADYNDPDNFIYPFFGTPENALFRSLCYPRLDVMERVQKARAIQDAEARLTEYRELERIIVQEDAAWIPLFSRMRYYMLSERAEGFRASWNGSVKNNFRYFSVK